MEVLTSVREPNPIEVFKAVQGPTIAQWAVHKSRRKREMEVYQDTAHVPWRGERQAQTDVPRTTRMAAALDKDLAAVPPVVRRLMPAAGTYPLVRQVAEGTGLNPFLPNPDAMDVDHMPLTGPAGVRPLLPPNEAVQHRDLNKVAIPESRIVPMDIVRNPANVVSGPGAPMDVVEEGTRQMWYGGERYYPDAPMTWREPVPEAEEEEEEDL